MTDISQSDWSETDASNNSTPPDGWPSSTMLPTQVEPAARAIRGAIKRFWDRIQGANASTGSANAYVLTPSVALGAYVTGERYSFRSNFANTGAATLNISAIGAKTIKKMTASGKADLASGDIQSGQPVTVEYDGTDLIVTTAIANVTVAATNSLGGSVTLNNIANYFDGPSVAQGTTGTWVVEGTVTVIDTAGGATFYAKLWDGTTVIASGSVTTSAASALATISLSGELASPVGNLRISVRDITATSGFISFNTTGNSKDSTITAYRIG